MFVSSRDKIIETNIDNCPLDSVVTFWQRHSYFFKQNTQLDIYFIPYFSTIIYIDIQSI